MRLTTIFSFHRRSCSQTRNTGEYHATFAYGCSGFVEQEQKVRSVAAASSKREPFETFCHQKGKKKVFLVTFFISYILLRTNFKTSDSTKIMKYLS